MMAMPDHERRSQLGADRVVRRDSIDVGQDAFQHLGVDLDARHRRIDGVVFRSSRPTADVPIRTSLRANAVGGDAAFEHVARPRRSAPGSCGAK